MKNLTLLVLTTIIVFPLNAQEKKSPYRLKAAIDIPVIAGGAALSYLGLRVLRNKEYLDSTFVSGLKPEDVNRFDQPATKYYSESMGIYSDIALFSSIAIPFFLTADKHIRSETLKVGALYLETMAIMANAYVWGVSASNRIRPYVYNPDVPVEKKLGRGTTNSFFAKHCAAAAASTFFAAKVYSDYYPESKLRKYFWAAAIIPPAIVGYLRIRDGQHFPTDTFAGIPIGVAIGILVPHLHKTDQEQRTVLFPTPGGIGMVYRL
jgi:membrane-associated phospholipid phosphatase